MFCIFEKFYIIYFKEIYYKNILKKMRRYSIKYSRSDNDFENIIYFVV